MVPNHSLRYLLFSMTCGLCLFPSAISFARLINYENDPDLEIAMEYDSEYNGGDHANASQPLAEEYYLKYLEKCTESSQRAKVYCQLGVLYATNWHAEYGEKPDYEKCVMYMKKALEEEPVRIGKETNRARSFLVTPLASREERMNLRMEYYDWILKTKNIIDSADPSSEIWLPDIPGQPISDLTLTSFLDLFEGVSIAAAGNLVECASSFSDPIDQIQNLQKIIDRFPNTEAATEAASRLSELKEMMQKNTAAALDVQTIPEEPQKNIESEPDVQTVLDEPLKNIQPPPVSAPNPENHTVAPPVIMSDDSNTHKAGIFGHAILAVAFLFLVAPVFYIAHRRYRRKKLGNE